MIPNILVVIGFWGSARAESESAPNVCEIEVSWLPVSTIRSKRQWPRRTGVWLTTENTIALKLQPSESLSCSRRKVKDPLAPEGGKGYSRHDHMYNNILYTSKKLSKSQARQIQRDPHSRVSIMLSPRRDLESSKRKLVVREWLTTNG